MSDQLIPAWSKLSDVVATGVPANSANQSGEGEAFFQQFVEDLFPMNYPAAQALAAHLDVAHAAGPISVLDLAAGSGVWGIALAQASAKCGFAPSTGRRFCPSPERSPIGTTSAIVSPLCQAIC